MTIVLRIRITLYYRYLEPCCGRVDRHYDAQLANLPTWLQFLFKLPSLYWCSSLFAAVDGNWMVLCH